MAKPNFPNVPYGTNWVTMISPAWFQQLKRFCEWAAEHPRGDGNTILNTGDGTLMARRVSGGAGTGAFFPCFLVSLNEKKKLTCSGGWLNRNGEMVQVKATEKGLDPKTGYFCLCSTPDASGKWSEPEFKIQTPAPDAYPVAEIEVKGESVSIKQYPVAVAFILLVKQCPIAEF